MKKEEMMERLHQIGFRCTRCGSCCCETSFGSNIVMTGPKEIRRIMDATGMSWDEIAEPFPEEIVYTDGSRITFEWSIRRTKDHCIFFDKNRCLIYDYRPFICRTFPFVIQDNCLTLSDCPGIGRENQIMETEQLAEDLIRRECEEYEELMKVKAMLAEKRIPDGEFVVIDSEGMKVMNVRD